MVVYTCTARHFAVAQLGVNALKDNQKRRATHNFLIWYKYEGLMLKRFGNTYLQVVGQRKAT